MCHISSALQPVAPVALLQGAADKHKRDDPRQKGGGALPQQGPKDIRGVVCPWWNRPYYEQLKSKMESIMGSLRQMATEVGASSPDGDSFLVTPVFGATSFG
jgi:hypothetical protein